MSFPLSIESKKGLPYPSRFSYRLQYQDISNVWKEILVFFVNITSKHFWSLRVTSLEWQQKIWLPPMTGLEWVNGGTPSDRSLRLTQSDDITRQATLTELNVSINSHSWSSVIARVCRTDILIVGGLSQCTC